MTKACGCDKRLKVRVRDKAYFTDKQDVGKRMSFTPEGFLLCEDVPIARTGEQIYGPDETPIAAGPDGLVHVQREADEVFRPETIASFEGKDVVDEHPDDGDVNPSNWRDLSVGHLQNVHRGEGVEDDYLFADMLIKCPDAIAAIQSGKREVSCGYDAEYETTGPGQGRQYNIIGNHAALVAKGRCGPRCSIKDSATHTGAITMAKKRPTWKDQMKKMLGVTSDAELEEKMAEEAPVGDEGGENNEGGVTIHNHMHPGAIDAMSAVEGGRKVWDDEELPPWFVDHVAENNRRFDEMGSMMQDIAAKLGTNDADSEETDEQKAARLAAEGDTQADAEAKELEEEFEEEAPVGTGDKARKARDSAYFGDSFQETASIAEILVPGIGLPTFDTKAKPKATLDTLCSFRRSVLDKAYQDNETKPLIDALLAGKPITHVRDKMSCGAVRTLFRSVGAMKKASNSRSQTGDVMPGSGGFLNVGGSRKVRTIADLNKLNAEAYGLKH